MTDKWWQFGSTPSCLWWVGPYNVKIYRLSWTLTVAAGSKPTYLTCVRDEQRDTFMSPVCFIGRTKMPKRLNCRCKYSNCCTCVCVCVSVRVCLPVPVCLPVCARACVCVTEFELQWNRPQTVFSNHPLVRLMNWMLFGQDLSDQQASAALTDTCHSSIDGVVQLIVMCMTVMYRAGNSWINMKWMKRQDVLSAGLSHSCSL